LVNLFELLRSLKLQLHETGASIPNTKKKGEMWTPSFKQLRFFFRSLRLWLWRIQT